VNTNLQLLCQACDQLGVAYRLHHTSGNLVEVHHHGQSAYFAAWTTPLNSHAISHICLDKQFFAEIAAPHVPVPRTIGYFDPDNSQRYHQYVQHASQAAIVADIAEQFDMPVIVKRNRGMRGKGVFRCDTTQQIAAAVASIFRRTSSHYDFMALAQQHIDIRDEYRVLFLDGRLHFAYEKNIDQANFTGNLSRLHWQGARAILVEDTVLLERMAATFAPLFAHVPLHFCGLDVARDAADRLWLIEANTSPGFNQVVASCGPAPVLALYRDILRRLFDLV
jgi:glutathione synthase/RimK-type ligase-like ATP-grasp enzyme